MVTDMEDVHKEMSTDYSNGVVSGYTKKQLDINNDSIQTMIYVSTWRSQIQIRVFLSII